MTKVTVSPKFQIVIPKEIRQKIELNPGMFLQMIPHGDRIELIPIRPIKELRGVLKGINTNIKREKDRI